MVLVLQAEKASWNSIGIFKLSNISGKKRELVPTTKSTGDDSDMDGDGSDSDEDSENEEDGGSGTPILQVPFCFSNFICIVASIIIFCDTPLSVLSSSLPNVFAIVVCAYRCAKWPMRDVLIAFEP